LIIPITSAQGCKWDLWCRDRDVRDQDYNSASANALGSELQMFNYVTF